MNTRDWTTAWNEADGWAALSAYASVKSLPTDLRVPVDRQRAVLELGGELFHRLVDRGWSYREEPWTPMQGQLIRDPEAIKVDGAATCLDIAVLYAAMAKHAGLQPCLAVLENAWSRHAVVLLPVRPGLPPVTTWSQPDFGLVNDFYAIDVVEALLGDPGDAWARAQAADTEHFWAGSVYDLCHVIDVVAANVEHPDVEPLPADRPRPAIYQMLPPLDPRTTGELFAWQEQVGQWAAEYARRGGYLVVAGPSGMGKTAAALRPAHRTAQGAGWLLDAASSKTLQQGLTNAEIISRPRFAEMSDLTRPALFRQALNRLASSPLPWVVILDGADDPTGPEHYTALLPTPRAGQLVLITTTVEGPRETDGEPPEDNEGPWEAWESEDRTHRKLLQVPPGAPSPLHLGLGGSASGGAGDDYLADLVAARMGELPTGTAALARVLGWLPPLPAPKPPQMPEPEAAAAYHALTDKGLVDPSSRIMHRRVRQVLRTQAGPDLDLALLADLIKAYPQQFTAAGGADDLGAAYRQAIVDLFEAAPDPETATVGLLAAADALTRDAERSAATLYQKVLDGLGWSEGDIWQAQDPLQATRARACIEGIARAVWRAKDDLPRVCRLAKAGRGITVVGADPKSVTAQDLRLTALELLARKTMVGSSKEYSAAQKRPLLASILDELQQVYDWRKDNLSPGHPDIARALFNLPSTRITLAQNSPHEEQPAIYRTALGQYREVYDWRRAYFGTDDIEDVATCLNGQGIAGYYLALHDTSASARDRVAGLGQAAHVVARALQARQNVAWGTAAMSGEVTGSAALLAKITLALVEIGHRRQGKGDDAGAVLDKMRKEAASAVTQLGAT